MSNYKGEWFSAFQEVNNLDELNNCNNFETVNPSYASITVDETNLYNTINLSTEFESSDDTQIVKQIQEIIHTNKLLIADQVLLKKLMEKNEKTVSNYLEYIHRLEKEVSRLDQYGRRENIELAGLPSKIPDRELEYVVINILKHIGLNNIQPYDIAACHRLRSTDKFGNKNVIIRFINRKDAIICI